MMNIISKIKLYTIYLVFWFLLTFNFKAWNFIAGLMVCGIVTWLSYGILYDENGFKFKFNNLNPIIFFRYTINLLMEIYKSSFSYLTIIVKKNYEPCIVDVKLKVTDPLIISIISNSITLTPGTITVDTQGNKLKVLTLRKCSTCEDCEVRVSREVKDKFESFFIKEGEL